MHKFAENNNLYMDYLNSLKILFAYFNQLIDIPQKRFLYVQKEIFSELIIQKILLKILKKYCLVQAQCFFSQKKSNFYPKMHF